MGKGLVQAGNLVRFVTYRNYEALVKTHGLEFWPVEGNVQDVAQSAEMKELLERGNFLAIMSHMGRESERGAMSLAQAGLAACQGTDLARRLRLGERVVLRCPLKTLWGLRRRG